MRKLILIVAMLATLSAQGQTPYKDVYKEANGVWCWTFGMLGGTVGQYDGMTRGAIGLNATICGVYGDLLWWGSGMSSDVRVGSWTSPTCHAFHVGFQIPLTMHWRIIPVVGSYEAGYTITNGHHYTVDDSGIHNLEYSSDDNIKGFDYGVVAVYHIPNFSGSSIEFNFNLGLTRHCIYGGVSMNVNID